jgi:hypothetical protein
MRCTPSEVHAHELHAHEMHAYEIHAHEICAHEMHAHKIHAHKVHTHEVHTCVLQWSWCCEGWQAHLVSVSLNLSLHYLRKRSF